MSRYCHFLILIGSSLLVGCQSSQQTELRAPSREELLAAAASRKPPAVPDPYAPEPHGVETGPLSEQNLIAYWFSEAQLARMAQSRLDPQRFIAYVEREWTVARLQEYCVASNRWPKGYQNLVSFNRPIDTSIHIGKPHGFDRIWVYVSEDNGRDMKYFDSAGWDWHRWKYSLNVFRKREHWAIIETLPNNFMDSPEYASPDEQDILDVVKKNPLDITTDGKSAKYGDPNLDRAVEALSDLPHPWTVPKLIQIFESESGEWVRKVRQLVAEKKNEMWATSNAEDRRLASVERVLAASRDPRAALALGNALKVEGFPFFARIEAYQGLFDYSVQDFDYGLPADKKSGIQVGNMLPAMGLAVDRWWATNKSRLEAEAAKMPGPANVRDLNH